MPPLNEEAHIDDTSTSSGKLSSTKHSEAGPSSNERGLLRTVAELKSEICRMQIRNEELEQDRNYNAIKATELQISLDAFNTGDIHDALMTKAMQVAEAMTEIDLLKVKLKALEAKQQATDKDREQLSSVVRTLQNVSNGDSDDEDDDEVVLTAEKALEMTLKNMKFQIEILEEERQRLAGVCTKQKQEIDTLKNENHLSALRIAMLTTVIRDMNNEVPSKQPEPVKNANNDSRETSSLLEPTTKPTNALPIEESMEQEPPKPSPTKDQPASPQKIDAQEEAAQSPKLGGDDEEGGDAASTDRNQSNQHQPTTVVSNVEDSQKSQKEHRPPGELAKAEESEPKEIAVSHHEMHSNASNSPISSPKQISSDSDELVAIKGGDEDDTATTLSRRRGARISARRARSQRNLTSGEVEEAKPFKRSLSNPNLTIDEDKESPIEETARPRMSRRSRSNPDLFSEDKEASRTRSRRASKWATPTELKTSRPAQSSRRSRSERRGMSNEDGQK